MPQFNDARIAVARGVNGDEPAVGLRKLVKAVAVGVIGRACVHQAEKGHRFCHRQRTGASTLGGWHVLPDGIDEIGGLLQFDAGGTVPMQGEMVARALAG